MIQKERLRPSHYCTSIDLLIGSSSIIGIGTTSNPNADISTIPDSDLVASGIKRTGRMLTLDYEQDIYRSQPFATRQESVTPFLVTSYEGTIELVPESDTWIDTNRLAPNIIEIDNFTSVQQQLQLEGGFDQNGLGQLDGDLGILFGPELQHHPEDEELEERDNKEVLSKLY